MTAKKLDPNSLTSSGQQPVGRGEVPGMIVFSFRDGQSQVLSLHRCLVFFQPPCMAKLMAWQFCGHSSENPGTNLLGTLNLRFQRGSMNFVSLRASFVQCISFLQLQKISGSLFKI